MVDIPGNSTTTATMTVGGSTSGSLEIAGDHDWYRISLTAGQQIVINLTSPDFDCYLRIRDAAGNVIFENDDSGGSLNSRVAFQVPSSGTYYIDVGSYNDTGSGAFTLAVEPYTLPPTFTNDQIAHQLTDDYWFGDSHHWNVTQGGTITVNLTALTVEGQNYAREALALWTDVLGITFAEVTTGGNIQFGDDQDGAFANAKWSNGIISSATVNISTAWLDDYRGNGIANYAFQTYIHEIGHALGLGHAGDYNGDASYPYDATFYNDGWPATVMSYFDQRESSYYQGQGFSFSYALSPMVADIIAVGNLYGLSTITRTGDTTYGFNSNAGRAIYDATTYPNISYTIFDSAGNDTIDYSGFAQNQVLNLNPETYMNVGGRTGTVSIARGVVIENAIGGSGSDTITGNGVANLLVGNAGNDTLDGQAGDDRLRGGAGNDTLIGGTGNDTALYDDALAAVTVNLATGTAQSSAGTTAGIGVDTLLGIEGVVGGNFGDVITGNSGDNVLSGLGGDDLLNGGPGADQMFGGFGDDTYIVDNLGDVAIEVSGQGTDEVRTSVGYALGANLENLLLTGTSSINGTGNTLANIITGNSGGNVLTGLGGNDVLRGGAGNDTLDGGVGVDKMYGGVGDDTYIVSDATDYTYEYAGEGTDLVLASVATRLRDFVENLTLTGSANLYGTGNELDNVMTGNNGSNRLYGLDGNDTLYGLGGNDALYGGTGVDQLYGGLGNDVYAVSEALDAIHENAGEGIDTVYATISYVLSANVERLYLVGTGAMDATGNGGDNVLKGNDADNVLTGGDGNDLLYGYGGNDTLVGGAGTDKMYGREGDDTYIVTDSADHAYEAAGQGIDTVLASVTCVLRDNIEILTLTGGDAINGYGNSQANIITGNSAANGLAGRGGDDQLAGLGGDDILFGEDGNDAIAGGAGRDRAYGGSGSDTFIFADGDFGGADAASADIIHDFSQSEGDHIDFSAVDANSSFGGNQAFSFIGSAAFSNIAGQLRTEQIGANTYVMGDTNGDGQADFWIRLDGLHTLSNNDFVL